jgi:hypothetical protein
VVTIERTPWRHRLIVWPGMPFRTLPLPYLLHRYDVQSSETGWCGSFFLHRHAEDRAAFMDVLAELQGETVTIHRCSECGYYEGESPQGGCCPRCGRTSDPLPVEVRVVNT